MKNYNSIYKMIHPDGYLFIIIFVIGTSILFSISHFLGILGIVVTIFCIFFFRNPIRVTPLVEGLIISPADGLITNIQTVTPSEEISSSLDNKKMVKVSIFLNVLNVHINRIPINGKILKLKYTPGKFFNASLEKSSIHNERQTIIIEDKSRKNKIALVQIAGLIARRIICDLEEEKEVSVGEKFGLIRFGSRVDLYIPENSKLLVSKGQTAIAGETPIANFTSAKTDFPIEFTKS